MSMITFDRGTVRFVYRAAAIVIENDRILLCQSIPKKGWWFIPGGRVELLESSEESIRREMYEELNAEVNVERLLWIEERFFNHDGFDIHAVVTYYRVRLPPDSPLLDHSAVYHFEDGGTQSVCAWHRLDELDQIVFYPEFLREALHDLPSSPQRVVSRDDTAGMETARAMITFDSDNTRFNYRVAAVIIESGKVLLSQAGPDIDFWFPPGGRAELLESTDESLRREMREELSEDVRVDRLLWIAEYFFAHDGFDFHEVGLYYRVHLPESSPIKEQTLVHTFQDGGTDCLCQWHDLDRLDEIVFYPVFLREAIHTLPETPQHIIMRENG